MSTAAPMIQPNKTSKLSKDKAIQRAINNDEDVVVAKAGCLKYISETALKNLLHPIPVRLSYDNQDKEQLLSYYDEDGEVIITSTHNKNKCKEIEEFIRIVKEHIRCFH